MSRRERHTSTSLGSFLPSPAKIISHQQAFRTAIYLAIGTDVSGRLFWNSLEYLVPLLIPPNAARVRRAPRPSQPNTCTVSDVIMISGRLIWTFSCEDRQEAVILANAISVSKLADSMTNAISWARDNIQSRMGSKFGSRRLPRSSSCWQVCGREIR
jgi:hypothetical protein